MIRRRRQRKERGAEGAPGGARPAPSAVRDPVSGWSACLADPASARLWAEPFAEDLIRACTRAFEAFAAGVPPTGPAPLTLPISVPFDENGVVVLSSAPPKPDAPRVPAELELIAGDPGGGRRRYRFGLALARVDRQPLVVPGVVDGEGAAVPLTLLTFAVTTRGMAITGYDAAGSHATLRLGENTARALAVALLITIGVKLTKAGYPG